MYVCNAKKYFMIKKLTLLVLIVLFSQCTISYKFTGASIDYSKVKTLSVSYFPNEAPLVADPSLSQEFSEGIKDYFLKQTRLSLVNRNGDLQLEGEITGYDIQPMAIQADAIAAQTRVTLRVNVRFINTKDSEQDFEQTFSAYVDFNSTENFNNIKDQIRVEMLDQIFEDVFNKALANW